MDSEDNPVLLQSVVESDTDDGGSASAPVILNAVPVRTLNWWKLAALSYVTVAGGPFGMENAVQAAGALPTLIMVGILAVFWAMPQALMTAEMSTAFSVNGGYIVVRCTARFTVCI